MRAAYDSWRYERRPELRDKWRAYNKTYGKLHYLRNRARAIERRRAARARDVGADIAWHLKRRYGITVEDYNRMLTAQAGLCLICLRRPRGRHRTKLCVDHCHATGQVRGLLCSSCNSAIGRLLDDPAYLRRAVQYLLGDHAAERLAGLDDHDLNRQLEAVSEHIAVMEAVEQTLLGLIAVADERARSSTG
jgi:hypothetical protein